MIARKVLEPDLRDVLCTLDGHLLVSRYRSAEILALDADDRVIARLRPQTRTQNRVNSASLMLRLSKETPILRRTTKNRARRRG